MNRTAPRLTGPALGGSQAPSRPPERKRHRPGGGLYYVWLSLCCSLWFHSELIGIADRFKLFLLGDNSSAGHSHFEFSNAKSGFGVKAGAPQEDNIYGCKREALG